ncbi:Hypothetical protein AFL40_0679 [Mycobacterium tuberculosis]|nr:Hypothetical protein AFL40_0679 [Mycobacterium tuberculosis]
MSTPATRANPTTPAGTDAHPLPRHRRHQDRRGPGRPGRHVGAHRPTSHPGVWRSRTGLGRGRRDDRRRARRGGGRGRWCGDRLGRSYRPTQRPRQPINIGSWGGFPLRDRVAAAVPGVPVRLGGDGVCMALGEHWLGAGRGARFLLGLVVSTGVGGGLVLDGAPCLGRTGNAGHVGHVVVDPDGSPCPCGGRGCVETIASGPSLARWARANGWSAPPGAGAKELAEAAGAGDPVALRAFRRGAAALAAMIASVGAVCDLDLAVIGGGVAKSGRLLFEPLRAALADHARLDFLAGLRVVPAELGGAAGLVGAARLAAIA